MNRPTLFQIKEAIVKNVCAPDESEMEDLQTEKIIRTSTKREGDAELGMILLVGISSIFGYTHNDIFLFTPVEIDEYNFKLKKFKDRMENRRFVTKNKLILNYLRLKYGVTTVFQVGK